MKKFLEKINLLNSLILIIMFLTMINYDIEISFSKQGGYEIYIEKSNTGLKLKDYLIKRKQFNKKLGCLT